MANSEREERLLREFETTGFLSVTMEISDIRDKRDQAKLKLIREIGNARSLVDELDKRTIPTCNVGELIRNLRTIYTTYSKTNVISNLFPGDKQMISLKRESSELLDLADNIRYRFSKECKCQKEE